MSKSPRSLAEDLLEREDSDSSALSLEAFFQGEYVDALLEDLEKEDRREQQELDQHLAEEAKTAAREKALIVQLERDLVTEREISLSLATDNRPSPDLSRGRETSTSSS